MKKCLLFVLIASFGCMGMEQSESNPKADKKLSLEKGTLKGFDALGMSYIQKLFKVVENKKPYNSEEKGIYNKFSEKYKVYIDQHTTSGNDLKKRRTNASTKKLLENWTNKDQEIKRYENAFINPINEYFENPVKAEIRKRSATI